MALTREQKIERLRKIDALEAHDAEMETQSASVEEAPAEAEGGPLDLFFGGLGAAGKILDLPRGTLTGPALAAALEALTGKDVYRGQEHLDAINPGITAKGPMLGFSPNLNTFPDSNELFKRAGVSEGAVVSDYLPGFSEPGKGAWYAPERGGLLDFSVRGTGGFLNDMLIDPTNWASFGTAGLAKKGIQESALEVARRAAKGQAPKTAATTKTGKALESLLNISPAQKLASMLPRQARNFSQAPSQWLAGKGKNWYEHWLTPIEHQGRKYGKDEIGETMYRLGITSPIGMLDETGKVTDALTNTRDAIFQQAGAQGARVNIPDAMNEAQQLIAALRARNLPGDSIAADALQGRVDEYLTMVEGTPATPGGVMVTQQPGPLKDVGIPGKPGTSDQMEIFQDVELTPGTPAGPESNMIVPQDPEVVGIPGKPGTPDQMVRGDQAIAGDGSVYYEADVLPGTPAGPEGVMVTPRDPKIVGLPGKPGTPEKMVVKHRAVMTPGTPAGPEGVMRVPGPPVRVDIPLPGRPAQPGRSLTPMEGSTAKTKVGAQTSDAAWNEMLKTPKGQELLKPLYHGLNRSTNQSVARTLGPKAKLDVEELNHALGQLLATKQSQNVVQTQAERVARNAESLTGTDTIVGGVAAATGNPNVVYGLALRKVLENWRARGQMLTGAKIRQLAEGRVTGPVLDALVREYTKENIRFGSEDQRRGNPYGQEE